MAKSIDNCIEAYHASDYFQLEQLQEIIVIYVKELLERCQNFDNHAREIAPKLLSRAVEKMSPSADNELFTLLIEWVAKIPLEVIGFDTLSFQALQCLLSQTYSTQGPFVTPEYTIFRHAVIQATHDISENAISIIESQLPIWNELNKLQENPDDESDEDFTPYEKIRPAIKEMLSIILPFIDLRRIEINILADIIEPLQLLPTSHLLDAYRFQAREKKSLPHMRGIPLFEWNLQWEKNARGSNLLLRENNSVVESIPGENVSSSLALQQSFLVLKEGCMTIFRGEVNYIRVVIASDTCKHPLSSPITPLSRNQV
ncbi:2950_t:CDS:2 [Funneliformis geosporum]|uniref:2950_t:CDS:1 n=1 Tax=Funneliformis geosporum TaxID=1117311 RepID=A0A9W4STR1_9GLOM|nr:2950_t:CDS:2 [Funneliformis geosporum]